MNLTQQEQELLEGKYGEANRLAMEILVRVGEILGAKKLLKISSAHVLGHYGSLHEAGIRVLEKFSSAGGRYRVPTTVDPASVSLEGTDFEVPPEFAEAQRRLCTAHKAMGVIPSWSCTPYLYENIPKFGENIAWAESSAVVFANSILGARTDRMTMGLEVAASIVGRIPEFGLYIPENRVPTTLIEVDLQNLTDLDFHSIGYLIGKQVKNQIPFLRGIPLWSSFDQLKTLGAAAASSGTVALIHIEGISPEIKKGFIKVKKKKFSDKYEIGRAELKEVEEKLTTTAGEVDLVTLGCPHYSIEEMKALMEMVKGRKVSQKIPLWVYTSGYVKRYCEKKGYLKILEEAGVNVLTQTCMVISPLRYTGIRTIMTNSAKAANVIPSEHGIDVVYASTQKCVETAITGKRV